MLPRGIGAPLIVQATPDRPTGGLNRSMHHSATVVACAEAPCPGGSVVSRFFGGDGGECLLAASSRLSPEDGVGVFVEVVEELLDAGAGVQGLVAVELQVPGPLNGVLNWVFLL